MSEHLLTGDIKNYLQRTMQPAELLKADDHLAECDVCLKKVKDSEGAGSAADFDFLPVSSEDSEHLSYEALENYVDKKSDEIEREIADVHFQVCAGCRSELNGLIEMRGLVEADLQKQIRPEKPVEKSIGAQVKNLFSGWSLLQYGFAAAALLLLFFAAFWLTGRDSNPPEIAVTPPASNNNLPVVLTDNPPPANNDHDTPQNNNTNLQNRPPAGNKTDEFPAIYRAEVERALAANRLTFPSELSQLGGRNGKLMGGAADAVPFALESPTGEIIQTDRPLFKWRRLEGAAGYVVNIYDTNFNRVAGSPQISATDWQIDRPLARNKIYIWQVTAIKDGQEIKSPTRPAPDAKFKVIDAAQLNELDRLSREYKNEHLSLGVLYARAGLLDEAAREFQKEISQNPNSKAAQSFLQQIRRLK
jgi:hypothetical protein